MTTIQSILGILCIAMVALYIVGIRYKKTEGFRGPLEPMQAPFPRVVQASYIPRDSASATTAKPQLAKPDYRDWWDARDSLLYFLEAYDSAIGLGLPEVKDPSVAAMFLKAPVHLQQIEAYILNPESVPSRATLDRAKDARALADTMRRIGPADPWLRDCPA